MRTEEEITAKLDEAAAAMDATGEQTEGRVRTALIVRCLGWVLGSTDSNPVPSDLDA